MVSPVTQVTSSSLYCALQILHCQILIFFPHKSKICGNSASSKSAAAIFPTVFSHLVSVSYFENSRNVSNFPIIIIFVMAICDQWSFVFYPQSWCYHYDLLKAQMTAFLVIKSSLIEACTLFFRHNAVAHFRLQCIVNTPLRCTGKPEQLCGSPYCGVHFIEVAWSQTCNIAEVYVHSVQEETTPATSEGLLYFPRIWLAGYLFKFWIFSWKEKHCYPPEFHIPLVPLVSKRLKLSRSICEGGHGLGTLVRNEALTVGQSLWGLVMW